DECPRLAAAGAGLNQHAAPCQQMGNSARLNRHKSLPSDPGSRLAQSRWKLVDSDVRNWVPSIQTPILWQADTTSEVFVDEGTCALLRRNKKAEWGFDSLPQSHAASASGLD